MKLKKAEATGSVVCWDGRTFRAFADGDHSRSQAEVRCQPSGPGASAILCTPPVLTPPARTNAACTNEVLSSPLKHFASCQKRNRAVGAVRAGVGTVGQLVGGDTCDGAVCLGFASATVTGEVCSAWDWVETPAGVVS